MNIQEVMTRVNAALGPRKIECIGIGTAGSGHATKRVEANTERTIFGVIWVSEEQEELAKKHDFVWFIDIMVVHEGRLEDRPPEIQALPAQISIYTHDPRLIFDELLGALSSDWSYDKRFKTQQKWFHPGTYEKPKK
jgi:hypothetical protein